MTYLQLDALRKAPIARDPFEHVVLSGFVSPQHLDRVNETFPDIPSGGSYAVENLKADMAIKDIIDELDGIEFERLIEDKFGIDLAGRPKLYSLRGHVRAKDGRIHRDSKDKLVTVLIYLNREWGRRGGRLRLLRDGENLDNYAVEIPPDNGTVLVFRPSETSWHGHLPFEGERRALQMNWLTGEGRKIWHRVRHSVSAIYKRASTSS